MTISTRAPLLWLLLPFMAGLALAEAAGAAARFTWPVGLALAGAVIGAVVGRRREVAWAAAMVLLAGTAGFLWLPLRDPAGAAWEFPPREVDVELEVEQLFPPTPQRKTFSGLARVTVAEGAAAPLAGQRVYFSAIKRVSVLPEVSGRYTYRGLIENVPRGAEAVGFDRYLDGLGVRLRLVRGHVIAETQAPTAFRRWCEQTQARLQAILRRGLEDHPEIASVYAAMLLGEKALLSREQETAFMRSGVFHIFSISGLHVGVIAAAILSAMKLLRLPARAGRVTGLVVLWLYVQVTGGSVPAERAFLMIAFFLVAKIVRLPGNALAALAGAALATLLVDPRQLFSTGFQMSYAVVTALVIMGAPLAERAQAAWQPWAFLPEADWGWWRHLLRWLGRWSLAAVAVTWTATLASTPSSIGNFGLFSPGALAANLVVIPLSSLALVAGFVALLAGLLGAGPLVVLMNHAAALVIVVMDWLVRRGTELPGMYFAAEFRGAGLAPVTLVAVLASMAAATHPRWRRHALLWLPPLVVALILIFGVKFR
jgi:competence protein ComEC